jgi:hypothetical protein
MFCLSAGGCRQDVILILMVSLYILKLQKRNIEPLSLGIRLLVNNRPLSHYPSSFSSLILLPVFVKYDVFIHIYIYIKLYVGHYTVQIYRRLDNSHISCSYFFVITVPPLIEYCLSSSV